MATITIELTEKQLRAVLAIIGVAVDAQADPESGFLWKVERELDGALLEHEQKPDTQADPLVSPRLDRRLAELSGS